MAGKPSVAQAALEAQIAGMVRTLRRQRIMILAIGLVWLLGRAASMM